MRTGGNVWRSYVKVENQDGHGWSLRTTEKTSMTGRNGDGML